MKLLLLPGFMGVAADWEPFMAELGRLHPIAGSVLSAPYSPLPTDGPFILGGYSMGGRVAISLAHSAGCRGVISVSSSPGIRDERERAVRSEADEKLARRLENLADESEFRAFLIEWWSQPIFGGSTLNPEAREKLIQSRVSLDPRELAEHLRQFGPAAMPSHWHQWLNLPVPKLAIAGGRDPKYAAFAREMGPHRIVADSGHQIPLEQPGELARIVADFVAKLTDL